MNRREFVKLVAAQASLISVPAVLDGCARTKVLGVPTTKQCTHSNYFEQFGVDGGMLQRILQRGLSTGGDFSEVYLEHRISYYIGLEDGIINNSYTSVDLGAGFRVLKGESTGFAYSEDLSEKSMSKAMQTAAAVADSAPKAAQVKPLAAVEVPRFYHVDIPWNKIGIDQRLPLIHSVDKQARARDPRVVKVSVSLQDLTSNILVANSEGILVQDERPMTSMHAVCVAKHNGKTETGHEGYSARESIQTYSPKRLKQIAHTAVDRTLELFEAQEAMMGEYPVVIAPGEGGILLHEAMGHGFEADFNRKRISIYSEKLGQRIAPIGTTIIDDATIGSYRGSLNVDDEGTPGEKTVLVEDGILKSYLHDRISAKHYNVACTGSGRRQSFRFPPVPRMRNTYMNSGKHTNEEIISSVKYGLYAERFSNGQVNIGAGDFTFFLSKGRLIENGKLTHVVKDANLIGSGPRVLENVLMIGNDLAFQTGGGTCGKDSQGVPVSYGIPTCKVGAISIGGRKTS